MKKLLNPIWILWITILPLICLFLLVHAEYTIFQSMLEDETKALWMKFFWGWLALLCLHTGYAVTKIVQKKKVDLIYTIAGILTSVAAMYAYYDYLFSGDLVPRSVPDWMTSGNLFAVGGAFLTPTILYSLFCLVMLVTNVEKKRKPWFEFGLSLAIPFLFYIVVAASFPMMRGTDTQILLLLWGSIIAVFFILFVFFRLFYVVYTQRKFSSEYELFWKVPFVLLLPVAGLSLNYGISVFGDLTSNWFWVVLILNAVVLCLPAPVHPGKRLALFAGRAVTFSFTLYFFILFLPFLPFAMLLTLAFGVGILFLTPFILFIIHISDLLSDYEYLRRFFKPVRLLAVGVAGLCLIPFCITANFMLDRKILHDTLDYVYSPDYTKEYHVKKRPILRVLNHVSEHQSDHFLYTGTPYISSWYKWVVLDNMMLSRSKKEVLTQLVSGQDAYYPSSPFRSSMTLAGDDVRLLVVQKESSYDIGQQAWVSKVDLYLKAPETGVWNGEYLTSFELPDGCWISDYYLYVGKVKEPGILAERKAATWIYNQITRRNQDPGLLRYVSDWEVELKVFPFSKGELRQTGIEFVHADPVVLHIDGREIILGDPSQLEFDYESRADRKGEAAHYLSSREKALLPQGAPQPYYHFIVDISNNGINREDPESAQALRSRYERWIREELAAGHVQAGHYKVTYTNDACFTKEYKTSEQVSLDWFNDIPSRMKPLQKGFFLQRAMETILVEHYQEQSNQYPVLVVVTDNIEKSIVPSNLNELTFTYPFLDYFYCLDTDGLEQRELFGHWFGSRKVQTDHLIQPTKKVREYQPGLFVPDDGAPSICYIPQKKPLRMWDKESVKEKSWYAGLKLQERRMYHALHPNRESKEWVPMLKASFATHILTPHTAYMVVETEAQRMMLQKKQKETMSGSKNLDLEEAEETFTPMSEPELILLLLLLAGVWGVRKRFF